MASGYIIRKSQYYDSVFLMRIAQTINAEIGVVQSAVVMATDANKELLSEIGVHGVEIDAATPNDLIVVVIAESDQLVNDLLSNMDDRLQASASTQKLTRFRSIEEAAAAKPESSIVVISVPGAYAAREAHKALEQGKHVFLFSDNVPIDQEVELKQFASEKKRLLMGPDCGTSLIAGVGLGFANRVRRGPIGVVGASGTGIQEFTSLVHQAGSGISHAIGTGSHDLSDAVCGITTLMGIDALEADSSTQVIVVVSKPAGQKTLHLIANRINLCAKPVIGCFLGLEYKLDSMKAEFHQANTIDEAVLLSLKLVQSIEQKFLTTKEDLEKLAIQELSRWRPEQRYLRGLFAGGTFCYQAQQVLREAEILTYSNAPLDKRYKLENPENSLEHSIIDLGDDHFTNGKPHPMIDATQRRKRILAEGTDPEVSILLLDFVLGSISSKDPVGELTDAIREAKAFAERRGGCLTVVASICGTDQDEQNFAHQRAMLEDAGVLVFESNYQASSFCAVLLEIALRGRNGK